MVHEKTPGCLPFSRMAQAITSRPEKQVVSPRTDWLNKQKMRFPKLLSFRRGNNFPAVFPIECCRVTRNLHQFISRLSAVRRNCPTQNYRESFPPAEKISR